MSELSVDGRAPLIWLQVNSATVCVVALYLRTKTNWQQRHGELVLFCVGGFSFHFRRAEPMCHVNACSETTAFVWTLIAFDRGTMRGADKQLPIAKMLETVNVAGGIPYGWARCGLNRSDTKPATPATTPTTTDQEQREKNEHSRWDNVVRHKSPSSFHFAALNATHTISWKIYPLSNGFSHFPVRDRPSPCVSAVVHSSHLVALSPFFLYFHFTSAHLVPSILKCFSVSYGARVPLTAGICYVFARKYQSGKFSAIRI